MLLFIGGQLCAATLFTLAFSPAARQLLLIETHSSATGQESRRPKRTHDMAFAQFSGYKFSGPLFSGP